MQLTDVNFCLWYIVIPYRLADFSILSNLHHECLIAVPEMKKNRFVWTEAYNLKCKMLLHINTEEYITRSDSSKAASGLEAVFTLCLTEANNIGLKAIALPAFGTGNSAMVFNGHEKR